jgi:hypothetical protein
MASSLATGLKTTGIVKQAAPEDLAMSAVIEAIGQLQVITASMDQKNALVMTVNKQAFEAQRMLSDILQAMKSGNFDQKKALDGVLKNLKPLSIADTQGNPEAITINNAVKGAQDAVQKAMDALDKQSGGSAPKPDFRLFEIRSVGGVTTLVPVAIPGQ